MIEKIKKFLLDSRQELKKVNWPTRQETIRYTLFVVIFSFILAIFLGFFDLFFLFLLEKILGL